MDFLEKLPQTYNGNLHLLVVNDHYTKWVEAFALPNLQTQTTINKLIVGIICRHGCPDEVLTDRGPAFISAAAHLFWKAIRVKKIFMTRYHSRTNAVTERFNATFLSMCSMYVDKHQRDWDKYIPFLCFAYNTSVHPATNETPFFLMHGREPVLPIDVALQTTVSLPLFEVNRFKMLLTERLTEAQETVLEGLQKAANKSKLRWDPKVRPKTYRPGDRIWLFYKKLVGVQKPKGYPNRRSKLGHHWRGPFRVVQSRGESLYDVVGPNNRPMDVANRALMKPYHDWVNPYTETDEEVVQLLHTWELLVRLPQH